MSCRQSRAAASRYCLAHKQTVPVGLPETGPKSPPSWERSPRAVFSSWIMLSRPQGTSALVSLKREFTEVEGFI